MLKIEGEMFVINNSKYYNGFECDSQNGMLFRNLYTFKSIVY